MEKEHINIVTIGEKISGKSTLVGHLIYKLGGIDEETIAKVENKASEMSRPLSKYAWIMDQSKEEIELGKTITVSNRRIETKKFIVTLFNTPGSKDYFKNTLSGICLANAAIVVVDAHAGKFEQSISPNSHLENLLISTFALGIKQIIVAVNQIDSVNFPEERFKEIKDESLVLLKKVGFKENQINFIPVSGFFGDNLIEKSENLSWFKGNTMFEALDSFIPPTRPIDKPFRMNISNVYNISGIITVITGRVLTGIIKPGMAINIQPNNLYSEVKSIEMHHVGLTQGIPDDFIGINLKNISVLDLKGSAIISDLKNNPAKRCENFTAYIITLINFGKRKIGSTVMFFLAGQYIECKIKEIKYIIDKGTNETIEENPKVMIFNSNAYIVIFEPLKPMVVDKFSEFPDLGRFVIIDSRRVIDVGVSRRVIGVGTIKDFTPYIEIEKAIK